MFHTCVVDVECSLPSTKSESDTLKIEEVSQLVGVYLFYSFFRIWEFGVIKTVFHQDDGRS